MEATHGSAKCPLQTTTASNLLLQLAASAGEPQPPAHVIVPTAADAHHLRPEPDRPEALAPTCEPMGESLQPAAEPDLGAA